MRKKTVNDLIDFLRKLEHSKISFTLNRYRNDAIMIIISVPGQRWEIEFMEDGTIEIEKFFSDGIIYDENVLNDLFSQFSD